MIFSKIFAGVDQSMLSSAKKAGLNQCLKSFKRLLSKNSRLGLSFFKVIILSLSRTNLRVPSETVFNLLKSSTHWGSEAWEMSSKFFCVLFLEYIFDAWSKFSESMSYFVWRFSKNSINSLSFRSSIKVERCSAKTNEEISPLYDITDSKALSISSCSMPKVFERK